MAESNGTNPADLVSREADVYGQLLIAANELEVWPSPREEERGWTAELPPIAAG
jgi:hypothetical protein